MARILSRARKESVAWVYATHSWLSSRERRLTSVKSVAMNALMGGNKPHNQQQQHQSGIMGLAQNLLGGGSHGSSQGHSSSSSSGLGGIVGGLLGGKHSVRRELCSHDAS